MQLKEDEFVAQNSIRRMNLPCVEISKLYPKDDSEFAESIGGVGSWSRDSHIGLVVG